MLTTNHFEWIQCCLLTYCIAIFWFACLRYIDVICRQQGSVMLKCRCHHATPKTAYLMLASQRYLLYKPSYGTFCVQVLRNSLPWQQRLAVLKFKCHHLFARPRKPPAWWKDLGDICYRPNTRRHMAIFACKFQISSPWQRHRYEM